MRVQKAPLAAIPPRKLPTPESQSPVASEANLPAKGEETDPEVQHVAKACDAVYLPDPAQAKAWAATEGATDWAPFGGAVMRAMAYRRNGKTYLIFRGTKGARDIFTDLACVYWLSPPRHLGTSASRRRGDGFDRNSRSGACGKAPASRW